MLRHIGPALRLLLAFTVLTGVVYPLVVTGLCQVLFPNQANGSLLRQNQRLVGSALIGQAFASPGYFQPRPSAAGAGYDAMQSGGSNYGPTNALLMARVRAAVTAFRRQNPATTGPIPADLLTASGSGLDPDLSPAAAEVQVARIAAARHVPPAQIEALLQSHIVERQWGFLGEPRVNVLELNVALDQLAPEPGA